MDSASRDRITSKVLKDLEDTRFAASALKALSGGSANFIYRADLRTALDDGTREVLIKHSEGYVANHPDFKLTVARCRIEEECLKALSKLPIVGRESSGGFNFIARTPRFYHFDEQNNTQVQEYLPNSKDLKTYALKAYSDTTPETEKTQCVQLGRALGKWLRNFHTWAASQPELRKTVAVNREMQQLKNRINFSWLLDRVTQFPSVLSDAQEIFEEVKKMAAAELEDESRLQVIHGDFWTGNILLPDSPIKEGVDIPMFVIDWEMSQIGVPGLDVGQMIAELYELKLYRSIEAGLWMVQGFVEGYGIVSEDFAFRTAIQVGAHLVCFGTSVQGWGPPVQVEVVARTGKEIIVHAWRKDRKWFEGGDLACLFSKTE
ncbi:Uu.00g001600.m01.CDS01 [Anthostomella pinea]|uniref:Uu.00g001600.m01.CDS01 n=1 Tax=Anthostomella pinea TaxID=933095 RepID=A0AAI8YIF3_9PEZI|nr:Uu.00g001600.m01.CDS01 [Anthostomella pinea]